MAQGRDPDAARLFIQIVQENAHNRGDQAEQQRPGHRRAPIRRAVFITGQQHDGPVPNAPDDAAQNPAPGFAKALFQQRVHGTPPARFLANGEEHIEPGGVAQSRESIDPHIERDGETALLQLGETRLPQGRIKGCELQVQSLRHQQEIESRAQGAQNGRHKPRRQDPANVSLDPRLPAHAPQLSLGQQHRQHGRKHGNGQNDRVGGTVALAVQHPCHDLKDPGDAKGPQQID